MFLDSLNIGIIDGTYSPITGQKEGNVEFLFYFTYFYRGFIGFLTIYSLNLSSNSSIVPLVIKSFWQIIYPLI